ncbi:MAG: CcmD family protein [Sedimentisphaerales bacterium]|nr:CcmD family protein [Sedimentisphaerales bacterium]
MFYLCLAFSVLWVVNFIYLFLLDRQLKDIGRRLDARSQH